MELISIFLPLISFFFCLSFFKILNPKIIAVVSSSLILQCGIAIPLPNPVLPSLSRDSNASRILFLAKLACCFANNSLKISNALFLLLTEGANTTHSSEMESLRRMIQNMIRLINKRGALFRFDDGLLVFLCVLLFAYLICSPMNQLLLFPLGMGR